MKKIAFHNLGCKVNAYETNAMIRQFEEHGFEIVPFDEKADIYVVNTCTVTSIADKKSRQMLHRAKRLNPDAAVVAVGCYVQADAQRALADEAIDIVIGNDLKHRAFELITAGESGCVDIGSGRDYETLSAGTDESRVRAFVKIQDGCNQFCSYCLIPYVRGRIRSADRESVLRDVRELTARGIKEIVLTGIHISSYGTENGGEWGTPLLNLIKAVSEELPDGRVRLGSLEPRIITPEFVAGLKSVPNLCPHFHLSLQSGCDETLRRMNRHYTAEEYAAAVELLRSEFEHPAITTDVIVGFPGEADEEFETTCRFLEKINLYELHVFKYSVRQGTRAEKLPGRIDPATAEKRSNILLELSAAGKAAFEKYYRGRSTVILAEEELSVRGERLLTGYNPEYVRFDIPAAGHKVGDFVEIIG